MQKLILLCLLVFAVTSCEDFLDEVPRDSVSPANFYNNDGDALAAVNGAYAALQSTGYYSRYWINASVHASDGAFSRVASDRGAINNLNDAGMLSSNRYNEQTWAATWQAVNRANSVLGNVPGIEMDEDLKARILAEATFVRALTYFNMVRRWGALPIILEETNTSSLLELQVSREPVAAVYSQIYTDLMEAIAVLPYKSEYDESDTGRASKEAAQGLLAKAYLYQRDFQNAKEYALDVIEDSPSELALLPEHSDLWEQDAADNSVESLFEVQYNGQPQGHSIGNNYEPRNSGYGPGQWGTIHARLYFFNTFDDDDKRKASTFLTEIPDITTGETVNWWENITVLAPHIDKYRSPDTRIDDGMGYNLKVLRYANVLLVAAEAINEVDGPEAAAPYVNQVRERAGLPALDGLSTEEMRDAIWNEYRMELAYEGEDYEELVRQGKLIENMIASTDYEIPPLVESNGDVTPLTPELEDAIRRWQPTIEIMEADPWNVLFPLPQTAVDKNPNLLQNDGY
ncbi:MAG: RagB/SusD family nutrient uptake outer membrane protein [Lewinella sp.]